MREKLKYLTGKKSFHIAVILGIVFILLFVLGVIVLRYSVEGETNMPFSLTKISIISSNEQTNKEVTEEMRWAYDINQVNDIYLYIDKNSDYEKLEGIESVEINNIQVESKSEENVKIYKVDNTDEKLIFKNKEENIVHSVEFIGDLKSDLKNSKISNQGGIVAFRCSNNNISEYKSNDEIVNHSELLKNSGIQKEDLEMDLKFDLIIKLIGGKEYKSIIDLKLPIDNVIEDGTTSSEITDLKNFIFKRIKNH